MDKVWVCMLRVKGILPVKARGGFVEAEAYLVREDLFVYKEKESVVDVLLEDLAELSSAFGFFILLQS